MRAPPPGLHFLIDGARDDVPAAQVELLRIVALHEALALGVSEDPALAPHRLGDEDPAHAGRPHHPGRMELHHFHVHQLRARLVGHRAAVAGAFPGVARHLVHFAPAAGPEDHGLRLEDHEPAVFAAVPKGPGDPLGVPQQPREGDLHVDHDAAVDGFVLQGPDELEPRAVAHMTEAPVRVRAKRPLEDLAFGGPVEQPAPPFELVDALRGLLREDLHHAVVVDHLPAAHGVGEVHLPAILGVDVAQGRGDAPFGHHGVGLAEQRLADQADRAPRLGRGDRGAQPRPPGADHHDVVLERLIPVGHAGVSWACRARTTPGPRSRAP